MSRFQHVLEALKAERAALQEELDWLDQQIAAFEARGQRAAAAGSGPSPRRRRAPSASAGRRRSPAPAPAGDLPQRIVTYLQEHPQSTAGDVAKGIGENRTAVATRLVELARAGEIVKAPRGYSAG